MSPAEFIPFAVPDIGEAEIQAVVGAMRSGWLTTGPNCVAFEEEFADFLGGGVCAIAVNSATAGLHLALEALGIGPGDEVLVPTWTFTATAEVVRYLHAIPVLVDVDPHTLNIDFSDARRKITPRTRALVPVHFAGLAVDPRLTAAFAADYGLKVVEDAAHSFPTRAADRWVGTHSSDAVVFSFYATKTMTTGEGGMVVVRDPLLAKRVRTMRLHGISRDVFDRYTSTKPSWSYEVVAPGFKDNLTDPAAAMGRVQLSRAHEMRDKRAQIALRYDEAFKDLPLVRPAQAQTGDQHAWHLYVLRLTDQAEVTRDQFIEEMARLGVGCSVHFIPLHLHPYWRDFCKVTESDLPVASGEFKKAFSLPIFSGMTDEQVDRVIVACRAVLK